MRGAVVQSRQIALFAFTLVGCGKEEPADTSRVPTTPAPVPSPAPAPAPTTPPVPTVPTVPTVPSAVFAAPFLWAPLQLAGATDFGFVPAPILDAIEPAFVTFTDAGADAGLGDSVSGGNIQGVAVAFVDLDGDGWDDVVAVNGSGPVETWGSQAWRNLGDGTFADASATSGIGGLLTGFDGHSVAAADLDADGDLDLYVGAHPTDVLLLNAGDGTFTDGTLAAGAGGPVTTSGGATGKIAVIGDYDADGILDIASAVDGAGYVLRGLGGGLFSDVTLATGFAGPPDGTPCAVMFTDANADGRADLAIWTDNGSDVTNRVLLQSDGAVFTDVHAAAGWTNAVGNPMGIDAADLDRDGYLDYVVGDFGTSQLLLSTGPFTWVDAAGAAGFTTDNAWGLGFEDLDADGWWDAFVAQPDPDEHLTFTHTRSDPPTFVRLLVSHGSLFPGNVPAAFADYDHDGDTDVVTGAVNGRPLGLFRNDTDRGTNRWLEVRAGVGARVVVSAGGVVTWRDVTGGASRASQSALSARFGLGQWTGAEWVGVLWPDGTQQVFAGVSGDAVLTLAGSSATIAPL